MDQIFDNFLFIYPAIALLEAAGIVLSILYMHYSSKHRNYTLSAAWYICAVFFNLITLIVFLVKKKDFPSADNSFCNQCGKQFPSSFQVCPDCMIDLQKAHTEEKNSYRKKAKVFGILLVIVYVISVIIGVLFGVAISIDAFENLDYLLSDELTYYDASDRIAVDGLFYDQKGNSYKNEADVLLYDEQGRVYKYTVEEYYDKDVDLTYNEEYYIRDDGEKYFPYDCYVNEDGWFYCDKGSLLEIYEEDTASMSEEELDAYYHDLLNDHNNEYRYFDYPYVDAEGNRYYCAYEASWNAAGKLITDEADITTK